MNSFQRFLRGIYTLSLLFLLTAANSFAQVGAEIGTLDTKHFIPPIYVASGSADPADVDNHYLWITTDSAAAFEVTVNDATTIGTATPLGIICVRNDQPVMLHLSGGAHNAAFSDAINCPNQSNPGVLGSSGFGSKGLVTNTGVNATNTVDGFILESFSTDRFYANIRHSANSQGGSLTAKGHTALGQRFRSGHVLTNNNPANKKAHFISVMALTDDTRVTFADVAGINFVGLAADTAPGPFDLDQYESVVVAVQMDGIDVGEDPDELNATLVTTSDATGGTDTKLIVMNSGSFLAGLIGQGRDIGFDQVLPVDYLGTEFVMARGAGTTNQNTHQRPIVVADNNDTKIFLNGSLTPITTIQAGEYFDIPGSNFQASGVIFIETSQPAAVYQNMIANNSDNGQGLNYIPAVFPNLESQDVVIADVAQLGSADIDVIATAGATLFINGVDFAFDADVTGPTAITGTANFEIYKISNKTGTVTITSVDPFFTSVSVAQGARGAAGFYTGFPNSYAIRDNVTTGKNAAKIINVLGNDIKGFFDFFVDSATVPVNGGTVMINGDNTITYTPPLDYVGTDTFQYTIEDQITGFQDVTVVTVTVIEAPGAVADELEVWLKADGDIVTSGSDVTAWNNEVPNVNVPDVTPSGTNPELISSDTNFNFNPVVDFQNESLTRTNLDETDLVDTSEGTLFVVTTTEDSPLTISSTTAAGTCGANRCSTGFRSTGGQFSAGQTTYGAALGAGKANILAIKADSTIPGAVLSVNGLTSSSINANPFDNSLQYQIGVGEFNGTTITGRIAEAITYSRNLTDDQFQQVETYLAVKYGITLDQTGTGRDYVDSNGNIVFDADTVSGTGDFASYDSDIAGISRDDGSLLDQRKSKSINTGSIFTAAHGSLSTPTQLDDTLDYLVWGHDGTSSSSVVRETIGATVYERLQRVYRVQNNGSVAGVAVEFNLTGLGLEKQNTQIALLIDNDLTFSNATLHTTGRNVVGDVVTFTGVNFSDRDYFTLVLQEEPEVNWSAAAQNQDENSGNMTFTASLNYASNLAVSVPYTLSGSATGSGTDYSITASPTSISAGSTSSATITVTVIGEVLVEADETVIATIGTPTNAKKGTTDVHTATINNDDTTTVTLAQNVGSVNEGGNLTYTATLSNPVQGGFDLSFTTNNGTATTADSDYTDNDGSISFAGTASEVENITVMTTGDSKVELDETISVALGSVSGLGAGIDSGDISLAGSPQSGTITNNDQATITISGDTENEGTSLSFTISINNPVDVAVGLTTNTSNGTATLADSDYTQVSGGSVTFPAGSTANQSQVVATTVDSKVEADETISLILSAISASGRDVVFSGGGATLSATGTINNEDTTVVTLAQNVDSVNEGGNLTYTATLSNPVQGGFNLSFTTSDGTATTADSDYTDNDGTLAFTGTASEVENITVVTTADSHLESDETISVALGSFSGLGAGISAGDLSTAGTPQSGTIVNEDTATVSISDTTNGNESGPVNAVFTVTLNKQNKTGANIVVNIDPSGGSATAGPTADYIDFSGSTVTIANNQTSNTFAVTVNDDSDLEPTETIGAAISSPNNPDVSLGTASDLVNLLDNDGGTDDDSDGIVNSEECPTPGMCPDSDGDGIPDYQDDDSDNDGENDSVECTTGIVATCEDADGDGIPDYLEPDNVDTDGDGIKNDQDGDDDNSTDSTENADGDDTSDECSAPNNPFNCPDTDGDGIPDYLDIADGGPGAGDSDGDGIPDDEECPGGILCPDSDGDGIPDYTDTDSDNDGKDDSIECTTGVVATCEDADGDGIPDYLEPDNLDSDGDGVTNDQDGDDDNNADIIENGDGDDTSDECSAPNNPFNCPDTDGDGIPDYLDIADGGPGAGDSDGDGINDDVECPNGILCPDSDGDGIPDYLDTDSDNDGLPDAVECTTPPACEDADADGIPDYQEPDIDTDGDGINDSSDTDADGDGIDDSVEYDTDGDGDGADDTDGDGIPDFLDGDSDGDGVTDADELAADTADCTPDPTVPACAVYNSGETAGTPTTGDSSGDSDGDGIPDDVECPNGILCPDTDNDGVPDYFDLDSDNDGLPDAGECTTPPACEDADADGIPDYQEPDIDTDGDGTPDGSDTDADGDGIDDSVEYDTDGDGDGADDTDGDGIPDFLDGDSDGDGVTDADELAADAADCTPDPTVAACAIYNSGETAGVPTTGDSSGDSDGDGIPDAVECPSGLLCPDSDGDGVPDYFDSDSDNDGLPDAGECTTPPACEDADADGIPDYQEPDIDTDNDGTNDGSDTDADGDGIDDAVEYDTDGDGDGADDTDGDGIPDFLDGDSDGDGVTDADELAADTADCTPDPTVAACAIYNSGETAGVPTTGDSSGDSDSDTIPDIVECPSGLLCPDTDNDGIPDYFDPDSDNDGIDDSIEVGGDPLNPVDTDMDGTPDYKDTDSDNDGINDSQEGTADGDMDGIPDYRDNDSDNDGIPDNIETDVDTDGDGVNDNRDPDSDNDSIPDSVELASDADMDGLLNFRDLDSDGDGIMDIDEAIASVAITVRSDISSLDNDDNGEVDNLADQATVPNPVDTDNDGIIDVNDLDSDGDGLPDSLEAQLQDAQRDPTGVDSDGDGIDDAFDIDHQGALILPDSDNDGLPDFRDFDSDNDGIPDSDEGFDFNGDGMADIVPSGLDSDGDGLDDAFDPDSGFINPGPPDTDGDGTPDFRQPNSVAGCTVNDQTPTQIAIDGSARALTRLVTKATRANRKQAVSASSCNGLSRSKLEGIKDTANSIYDDLWSLTWITIQSQEYDCNDLPPVCSELDITNTQEEMRQLAKRLVRQVKRALGDECVKESKRGKSLIKRAKRKRKVINRRINNFPNPFLVCN